MATTNLNTTGNALLNALRDAVAVKPDKVEKGYMPVSEWAVKIGKSDSRTSKLLSQGIKAGKVELKTFRIYTGRKIYPIPHYRLKP